MNLINERVRHAKFGAGEIVNIEEGRIIVKFTGDQGEKSFLYPDAFATFLVPDSPQVQKYVQKQVHQKEEKSLMEKKLKMDEAMKREEERKEEKLELAKSKKKTTKSASKKMA